MTGTNEKKTLPAFTSEELQTINWMVANVAWIPGRHADRLRSIAAKVEPFPEPEEVKHDDA